MKRNIIISAVAVAILAAVLLLYILMYPIMPMIGVDWKEKDITYTNETGNQISVILTDKKVSVFKDNNLIWESPDKYKVQDVLIADVDKGSRINMSPEKRVRESEEIILLLWKKGRFGRHKPFWIKEDKEEAIYSQHIFLYNIVPNGVRSKWGSSYMGMIAKEISYENEILHVVEADNRSTDWKWDYWGFVKQ